MAPAREQMPAAEPVDPLVERISIEWHADGAQTLTTDAVQPVTAGHQSDSVPKLAAAGLREGLVRRVLPEGFQGKKKTRHRAGVRRNRSARRLAEETAAGQKADGGRGGKRAAPRGRGRGRGKGGGRVAGEQRKCAGEAASARSEALACHGTRAQVTAL